MSIQKEVGRESPESSFPMLVQFMTVSFLFFFLLHSQLQIHSFWFWFPRRPSRCQFISSLSSSESLPLLLLLPWWSLITGHFFSDCEGSLSLSLSLILLGYGGHAKLNQHQQQQQQNLQITGNPSSPFASAGNVIATAGAEIESTGRGDWKTIDDCWQLKLAMQVKEWRKRV